MRDERIQFMDRNGRGCEVHIEDDGVLLSAWIVCDGHPIGRLWAQLSGDTAEIQDFHIHAWRTVTLCGFLPVRLPYGWRGKGIGHATLLAVCQYLRAHGFRRVTGQMVGDTERLRRFYTRAGFTVETSGQVWRELTGP